MHWRVAYPGDNWFHIIASSDNPAVGDSPNGFSSIFSRNNEQNGPKDMVTVLQNDKDGYTPDEAGAMKKMIDIISDEMRHPPLSTVKF